MIARYPLTREPLQAWVGEDVGGVTLKLTGKDLHSDGNRLYQPKRAFRKIKAKYNGRSVKVQIVGENIHDIPEFEAYYVDEESPLQSIGYLGTQILSEYSKDPSIDRFEIRDNCIDLGRYGPFRKQGTNEMKGGT